MTGLNPVIFLCLIKGSCDDNLKLMRVIIENKKAFANYHFIEKFQAGIVLIGQEVKSIKEGRVNLSGSFISLKGEEVFWVGATIPPYQPKNAPENYNPQRERKLLLTKPEIRKLIGRVRQRGLTIVPLMIYTKRGNIKMKFALARGKGKVDKREQIKKREIEREIKRALKET